MDFLQERGYSLMTSRPFRFGVITYQAGSKEEWITKVRRAEQLGYAVLLAPDHFGEQLAVVPALLAAAEATTTLRVGSYVFDNDFRHPAMLAKEAATLDILSGGRFELGIGAGWMRSEYEQVGIAYESGAIRTQRLEETLQIVKGLFAEGPFTFSGTHYTIKNLDRFPKPLQQPHPPLLVGGAGKRILSVAAREASIVSLAARVLPDGSGLDTADTTPQATLRKIEWIRQAAGERFSQLELNMIIFAVVITEDRLSAAQQLAESFKMAAEQVLTVPHCLIGTADQICEDLLKHREQYGVSYIAIFEDSMEAFAPVVARLMGK
jgi:probable F420-dependent oxidoreductase